MEEQKRLALFPTEVLNYLPIWLPPKYLIASVLPHIIALGRTLSSILYFKEWAQKIGNTATTASTLMQIHSLFTYLLHYIHHIQRLDHSIVLAFAPEFQHIFTNFYHSIRHFVQGQPTSIQQLPKWSQVTVGGFTLFFNLVWIFSPLHGSTEHSSL